MTMLIFYLKLKSIIVLEKSPMTMRKADENDHMEKSSEAGSRILSTNVSKQIKMMVHQANPPIHQHQVVSKQHDAGDCVDLFDEHGVPARTIAER